MVHLVWFTGRVAGSSLPGQASHVGSGNTHAPRHSHILRHEGKSAVQHAESGSASQRLDSTFVLDSSAHAAQEARRPSRQHVARSSLLKAEPTDLADEAVKEADEKAEDEDPKDEVAEDVAKEKLTRGAVVLIGINAAVFNEQEDVMEAFKTAVATAAEMKAEQVSEVKAQAYVKVKGKGKVKGNKAAPEGGAKKKKKKKQEEEEEQEEDADALMQFKGPDAADAGVELEEVKVTFAVEDTSWETLKGHLEGETDTITSSLQKSSVVDLASVAVDKPETVTVLTKLEESGPDIDLGDAAEEDADAVNDAVGEDNDRHYGKNATVTEKPEEKSLGYLIGLLVLFFLFVLIVTFMQWAGMCGGSTETPPQEEGDAPPAEENGDAPPEAEGDAPPEAAEEEAPAVEEPPAEAPAEEAPAEEPPAEA